MQDAQTLLKPRRAIRGMSAILLPFAAAGEIDWRAFEAHLERTVAAGLTPALNMDTGYVQLLSAGERQQVLEIGRRICQGGFVAGAFVKDQAGDPFDASAYAKAIAEVCDAGGTPILFPSHGLNSLEPEAWVEAHRGLAGECDRFLGFELGPMFVPYGRIYSEDAYAALLEIPQCVGAKHSSLSRELEWKRLALRDARRPDFMVLTGNDLAIDMVMYGSDYLLGLSTFAPDLFAKRDQLWRDGDADFYELNDALQYLGAFAFREPVPAYRHDAAIFLHLRGFAQTPDPHPGCPLRPPGDREVLAEILRHLEGPP